MDRNERRRNRTRQELLEATADLLIELGYDALTVQDITDEVDVARATFYIHFRDKEEAVWMVLEENFGELLERLERLEQSEPEQYRLAKFLALFTFVAEQKTLMRVLLSDKSHIKLVQQITRYMATTLQTDLERGRVERTTNLPTVFEANFYAGAIMQVLTWWLTEAPTTTPEALAQMVYQIVLREPNTRG